MLHHLDMPLTRQTSFNIAPGTENEIAVTPSVITTTESDVDGSGNDAEFFIGNFYSDILFDISVP